MLRDAVLAVSGKLNPKMFGASVPVMPDEVGQIVIGIDTRDTAGRPTGKVVSLGDEVYRRSVYVQVRRTMPLAMLDTFDGPRLSPNCEARSSSTVAPQALLLMNNEFVVDQAQAFAERVRREAGADRAAQIRTAWQWAFAEEPTTAQLADAQEFLAAETKVFADRESAEPAAAAPQKAQPPKTPAAEQSLRTFCQALLSSNRFLYVD
jgi:hypothetical protein